MGAFFLWEESASVDEAAVRRAFARQGFAPPAESRLGRLRLLHYRKQAAAVENQLGDGDGWRLFAVGTPIYRGLPFSQGLARLLAEARSGALDATELSGNYAVLIDGGGRLTLLLDGGGVQPVFCSEDGRRASTSFLALLASFRQPQALDRLAFLEKATSGYVIAPDTLVASIRRLDGRSHDAPAPGLFKFNPVRPPVIDPPAAVREFSGCVEYQVKVLDGYLQRVAACAREYGLDLGLSGGYDSRLLLLLACRHRLPVSVHTHATAGMAIHEGERRIVEQIAAQLGVEVRVIPSRRVDRLADEEVGPLLEENLHYFDGRSSDNSGACSETYTPAYRRQTLGGNGLTASGLGGELYRNSYLSSRRRVSFPSWLENRVFFGLARTMLRTGRQWQEVRDSVLAKLGARLGVDAWGPADLWLRRRYYADVRLPDCEGPVVNAQSKLALVLAPFMEVGVRAAALLATPHIGLSGRFQAAMLRSLHPEVAAITSHYGFPLTAEPLRHRLYAALRGYLPEQAWLARTRLRIRAGRLGAAHLAAFEQLHRRSPQVREAFQALLAFFPEVDWRAAMRSNATKENALFLGFFLRAMHDRLK